MGCRGMDVAVYPSMIPNESVHSQNTRPILEPLRADAIRDELVPISLDERVREFEASLITWALTACRGNKSRAARLLTIKRSTLGDRIHRCGLDYPAVVGEERR
jgi:DNA-binding NtrC family response regulator